uniref:hypothetical chloroplast RF66 n=1 Tax=Streptosarcina costaricana TaxID=2058783 RepID=UPI00286D6725|nr:hypothetical chloroplast RF66 [Streptosarcina costaricana]WKT08956.1 hypothetical chloroplast RF66 [Streptosarcina costaricana]
MINVEVGPSTMLGVALVSAGILLYSVRAVSPWLVKDYDVLFSTLGLLTGGILIFQGWRLDPILLFCQICSTGTAFFFTWESLRLRFTIQNQKQRPARNPIRRATNAVYTLTKPYVVAHTNLLASTHAWSRGYLGSLDYRKRRFNQSQKNQDSQITPL